MSDIDQIVTQYPSIFAQVSRDEVRLILTQLNRVLLSNIAGDVVEFGCYKGATSLCLARLLVSHNCVKKLWLYDSFMGLPDKSPEDTTSLGGDFQKGCLTATKNAVLANFRHYNLPRPIVKKSWFSDLSTADLPSSICWAYFDGDYYDSIRASFAACQEKLSSGSVIIVDDYANEQLPGVAKAVDRWCVNNRNRIKRCQFICSLAIIELN